MTGAGPGGQPVDDTGRLRWPRPGPTLRVAHTDALTFLGSLDDEAVSVLITDPPYSGLNRRLAMGTGRIVGDYSTRHNSGRWFSELDDDPAVYGQLLEEIRRVLCPGGHFYMMLDPYSLGTIYPVILRTLAVKSVIVWAKMRMGTSWYYRRSHELIAFATNGGGSYVSSPRNNLLRNDIADVITVSRLHHRDRYPTQKPVGLFDVLLSASAPAGVLVADPFCGSGAVAVAALRAGCSFAGADISGRAVGLTRSRWAAVAAGLPDPGEPPPRRPRPGG